MSIEDIIKERNITEVVHFTTQQGLTGILHQQKVQARAFLGDDKALEYILKINTQKNFDPEWKKYVNLSIMRINLSLFGPSQYWHPDAKWRILAFDPAILSHPDVQFVTTNNAYRWHLDRGTGPESLSKLFAPEVKGVRGTITKRTESMPSNWTTDIQAEVLYPTAVSTAFLQRIIVQSQEDAESVAAKLAALSHPKVPIVIMPEAFR